MKIFLAIIAIIVAGLILLAITIGGIAVGTYNNFVDLSQNVDKSWAQVQNTYQRRNDLIPNLVETVKGAARFEKDTFVGVAEARASVGKVTISQNKAPESAEQLEKYEKAQGNISQALSKLMVISENYPQLTATQQFKDLTVELAGTENRISVERMNFNSFTNDYNKAIQKFPDKLIAGFFNFKEKPYFKADEKAQSAPVVKFN